MCSTVFSYAKLLLVPAKLGAMYLYFASVVRLGHVAAMTFLMALVLLSPLVHIRLLIPAR